jgi:hypothetical protein
MNAKNVVLIGVAAAMAPLVQNAAIEEHQPACGIEARPDGPAALACPDKQPAISHDERDTSPQPQQFFWAPGGSATMTRVAPPTQFQSSGAAVTTVSA